MAGIREMIRERSEKLRNASELSPHEIADILLELTSLLSSLSGETVEAEYWYKTKLQLERESAKSAVDAKIKAEISPEWKAWRERDAQLKSLIELIRSCKKFLAVRQDEYNNL